MTASTQKQLRQGKIRRGVGSVLRHLVLAILAAVWLVPIVWLLVTSFSSYRGINITIFFRKVIPWTITSTCCSILTVWHSSRSGLPIPLLWLASIA